MAGCREEAKSSTDINLEAYGEYLKEQNQFNASLLPSKLSDINMSTNIEHSKVQFGE